MPTESREEVEAAARVLLDQGIKNAVLVKRGKNGSLLVTRESAIEQGIFEAGKVIAGLPEKRVEILSTPQLRSKKEILDFTRVSSFHLGKQHFGVCSRVKEGEMESGNSWDMTQLQHAAWGMSLVKSKQLLYRYSKSCQWSCRLWTRRVQEIASPVHMQWPL